MKLQDLILISLVSQYAESSVYEEGLPPIAYDPWFSTLLIRILLATNPQLLAYAVSQRPRPLAYDGLSQTELLYPKRQPKYYPLTDNVANSQPFGAYKYSTIVR
ncbi:unnamed protein product [Nezara viridula]|uniref:Uncharacterized protein n=1 Tax=Nezara viridula TaxID=85310 RepID=A0A9P0MKQ4_NEZVI|nr:unnamed protein product [Nezara viridula]